MRNILALSDYKMGPYANINLNNDGRYDLYTKI